jgi:hypothetical protein
LSTIPLRNKRNWHELLEMFMKPTDAVKHVETFKKTPEFTTLDSRWQSGDAKPLEYEGKGSGRG